MFNIIVLWGGDSEEGEVSLRSGRAIFQALDRDKYQVGLIEIEPNNKWRVVEAFLELRQGEYTLWELLPLLEKIKDLIVFNALHGRHGEDGRIQALLESANISYTGSGVQASAIAMNKYLTNTLLGSRGLPTIPSIKISERQSQNDWLEATKILQTPLVVKPNQSGSSFGVSLVHTENQILLAIKNAFQYDSEIIVEQFVKGREFTCGVLGNSSTSSCRALPVVEIIKKNEIFDFDSKYLPGVAQEVCPPDHLEEELQKEIQKLAIKVHEIVGCSGLSRTDMIMDSKNNIHILEINTSPGMTEQSLCPLEIKAEGKTFSELLTEIVNLSVNS
jgi:D-alanine-D-alanine ligase